ncbi:response regulator [Rhodopirellula sp. MGV]|uniref:response regulator n=1 Tax=Rhodopirellula sp. MGV TaxID=2023130 RepID=UPI000B9733A6|nr:response regulator [Rhodopirellula sp. MGV]OYP34059.1 hypothetical protein CGZ80_16760 [Rhodopirellula sp. MGV]PNY38313.1 response regulator [Rhodopirellula baltica]
MTSDSKKILIAEDNPGLARVLSFKFQSCGFTPITCADGATAWEAFQDTEIAAVVSDHEMPALSGLELIARIRQLRPEMPCFLVTGRKLELSRDPRVIELGVQEVFGKPFSPAVVVEAVAEATHTTLPERDIIPPINTVAGTLTAVPTFPGVHQ